MCPITLTAISVGVAKAVVATKVVATTATAASATSGIILPALGAVAAGGTIVAIATKGPAAAGALTVSSPVAKTLATAAPLETAVKWTKAVAQTPTVMKKVAVAASSETEVKKIPAESSPKESNAEKITEGSQKETDKAILSKLEKPGCPSVSNLEKFMEMVEAAFSRHPEEALFLREKYEKCLEEAKYRKKHPVLARLGDAIEHAGTPIIAGVSAAVSQGIVDGIKKIPEEGKKELAEQDKDILDFLTNYKDEQCTQIRNVEKFRKLVTAAFSRDDVKSVTLEARFQNCVELSTKN